MNDRLLSALIVVFSIFSTSFMNGQCENWIGKPTQSDAENAHSIYRQAMKAADYTTAFEQWKIAYKLAPAADGKRDYHYTDGIAIYKHLLTTTTDEKLKTEYKAEILKLYD